MSLRTVTILACTLALPGAWALPPGVTPVNPRQDDINPLSRGFGVPRADLRAPMNFERVYRISSDLNLFGRGEEYFARASGGLWAVFPASVYRASKGGTLPDVPPGTIWLIGDPSLHARPTASAPADTRAARPMDLRIDTMVPPLDPTSAARPENHALPLAEPTIWTSDLHRQIRVSKLLDEVAGAGTIRRPATAGTQSAR